MNQFYRVTLQCVLPAFVLLGIVLALLRIEIPWYGLLVVLPIGIVAALAMIGAGARHSMAQNRVERLQEELSQFRRESLSGLERTTYEEF